MPIYFKLPCLSPQGTKSFLTVVSLLLLLIGLEHWGYVGALINLMYILRDPQYGATPLLIDTQNSFFIPLAVYFSVTGLIQILASLLTLLALNQCFGKHSRSCGTKLLLTLLLFSFGLNLGYGAITGMNVTFYNQIWLNYHSFVDITDGVLFKAVLVYAKYTLAESIIAFGLTFPFTIVCLAAVLTPIINLDEESDPYSQKYGVTDQMNELSTRR